MHDGNINMARIIGITWTGHELLDNIRDNIVWNAVKKKAVKYSGLSISVISNGAKIFGVPKPESEAPKRKIGFVGSVEE